MNTKIKHNIKKKYCILINTYRMILWNKYFTDAKVFKTIWVDPWKIRRQLQYNKLKSLQMPSCVKLTKYGLFNRFTSAGLVIDNGWFGNVAELCPENTLLYKAIEQRFFYINKWEQTEFINNMLSRVKIEKVWNGCTSNADIFARCKNIDAMIKSIRNDGFCSKSLPVPINIGPHGEFVKNGDGQHRIIIGMIMRLSIPVHVIVRHSKWQDKRNKMKYDKNTNNINNVEYIDHPDMQDIL